MYDLSIVTPEKVIFADRVHSLIAPGSLGYLEILTDHAPIITAIKPGKLVVTDKNKNKLLYAVSHGFLEVSKNVASIIVDTAEIAS